MFAGTLCGRGAGGRVIEKAACGLLDRRGERGSRSKLLWGRPSQVNRCDEYERAAGRAPMASSSECRIGLISSRWSGSSHSVGSGSAGQCRSLRRLRGRSSSYLGSSVRGESEA